MSELLTERYLTSFVLTCRKNAHSVDEIDYFDGFQIVAVFFIAEFSFRFCCVVFDAKQLLKVKFAVYYVMTKMGSKLIFLHPGRFCHLETWSFFKWSVSYANIYTFWHYIGSFYVQVKQITSIKVLLIIQLYSIGNN